MIKPSTPPPESLVERDTIIIMTHSSPDANPTSKPIIPPGQDEQQQEQQQQEEEEEDQIQQSKGQATREAGWTTVTKTRHRVVGVVGKDPETTTATTTTTLSAIRDDDDDTVTLPTAEPLQTIDPPPFEMEQEQEDKVDSRLLLQHETEITGAVTDAAKGQDDHETVTTTTTDAITTTQLCCPHPPQSSPAPKKERPDFHMGDHVYQWCRFLGIPGVFQHHGIVLDVVYDEHHQNHHHYSAAKQENGGTAEPEQQQQQQSGEWYLVIADFSNWTRSAQANQPGEDDSIADNHDLTAEPAAAAAAVDDNLNHRAPSSWSSLSSSSSSSSSPHVSEVMLPSKSLYSNSRTESCIRTYRASTAHWHKVEYNAKFWKRHFLARSGTCTTAESCPPALVRARLDFLLQHPNYLPPYSAVHSNCECVAVWCKTGTWGTLQATSWLTATAAGQAKSAATLAGVVSTTTVTVPSAGLWGWMGYTTQVSLAATQPYLLPAIAAYGIVTVGVPTLWLWHAKQKWKQWTMELNEAFWDNAVDYPELFVECITHWANSPNRDHVAAAAAASTKVVTNNKNEAAGVMGDDNDDDDDEEEKADSKPAVQKTTRTTEAGR